jgi:hypothetical protein
MYRIRENAKTGINQIPQELNFKTRETEQFALMLTKYFKDLHAIQHDLKD